MKIALLQLNFRVGDVEGNAKKIIDRVSALRGRVQLCVAPELSLTGYPPRDLLAWPQLLAKEKAALQELCALTQQSGCALLLGHCEERGSAATGAPLWNVASLFADGKLQGRVRKQRIPAYDIFSEERFFEPWHEGPQNCLEWQGIKWGVAICEDSWDSVLAFGARDVRRHAAETSPHAALAGANVLLNLSASPFSVEKARLREALMGAHAARGQAPLLYVNCVGGNDDVLFDGASFAVDAAGQVVARADSFQEAELIVELTPAGPRGSQAAPLSAWEELRRALSMGIADYVRKSGGERVLLGLSGGIDSAVVATLACDALGPQNVLGVSLPAQHTSELSRSEARILAKNLGCEFREISVGEIVQMAQKAAAIPAQGLAAENLQSRARGLTLMALANNENRLLLATGNKSELAMGYSTLYGDLCGALLPIGDLYKTEVYALAHFLNRGPERIPTLTLSRPPTAELAPGQRDEDSLPAYEILDGVLRGLIENQGQLFERELDWQELLKSKHSIEKLRRHMQMQEYKRRQAPPILRVHGRAFGYGWQMPLAKAPI